jgi:2-hydroxy-3-keto-5-methylthiopentenyl-1-phosphate phosphatase
MRRNVRQRIVDMKYRVCSDFDGTIATSDVTDLLLEAFAAPGWRDIEAQWRAGQIGSADCMARQVALLRCSRPAFDHLLDAIDIDPGFAGFVAFCNRHEIELTIVSDGLDYVVTRSLARAGLANLPIIANRLMFLGQSRHAMLSPHASPACRSAAGTCKCRAVGANEAEPLGDSRATILIGDGRSDFCAAGVVDFVFAKDDLLDHCRANGISHLPYSNFLEIARLMSERLPGLGAFRPTRPPVVAGDYAFLGLESHPQPTGTGVRGPGPP